MFKRSRSELKRFDYHHEQNNNSDLQMYISGGFTDGHFSDAMLCYNPKHDIWERRTPMQNPRGWHQMVTVKGKFQIYFENLTFHEREHFGRQMNANFNSLI